MLYSIVSVENDMRKFEYNDTASMTRKTAINGNKRNSNKAFLFTHNKNCNIPSSNIEAVGKNSKNGTYIIIHKYGIIYSVKLDWGRGLFWQKARKNSTFT